MPPAAEERHHHHRSTTKVSHKPFKSKHATKSSLRDAAKGKVDGDRCKRSYISPHQIVMSKLERKNHAKQTRQNKQKEHERSTSVFSGQNGAPRIVAVVPLSHDTHASYAIDRLNSSLDLVANDPVSRPFSIRADRFKQSIQYIPVQRDLFRALDACRVADYVIFVLSSTEEVDKTGELLLRSIESQGVSNIITVVQALDAIEHVKKRTQVLGSLKYFISHFFPTLEKLHSLDSRQECSNVMRTLCTSTPKGIRWRDDRAWMIVDEVQWPESNTNGQVVLNGIVRGQGLKANRLLQVGDWGPFQIDKIVETPPPIQRKRKANEMVLDEQYNTLVDEPDADQDDLAELAPEDINVDEDVAVSEAPSERKGVLLDSHRYFQDNGSDLPEPLKRVPEGTSSYQSAWYLGDEGDSGSDWEDAPIQKGDESVDPAIIPQDGMEDVTKNVTEADEETQSEYPQSEMFLDPSPNEEAEQIAAYRSSRRKEAEDDLEFPDEIELHPEVLARERLSKYRGLKSLRTSQWDTEEDKPYQPSEWNRLLQISDYRSAKGAATREALVGGVEAGARVEIHLRHVPISLKATHDGSRPLTAFSLHRHEHKHTVVNFLITLDSEHPTPLKSKDELILQCGPRRLVINPLFSNPDATPNDVHKFDRYLHPGRTAMATFIGPVTWGAVPTLFFQRSTPSTTSTNIDTIPPDPNLKLIATGTTAPPSTTRIIAKRLTLTGHPYKIHKKLVTVRYMFFNPEDVAWFAALQLWTRRGRSGFIRESLGTHGYFKASFDAKINPQDAVAVSLYKRVWPRKSRAVGAGELDGVSAAGGEEKEIEGEGVMEGVEAGA